MAPMDAGDFLVDIPGDEPTGANLEFDADFGALERAAQGKPEQQYGGTIIPAEPPDWKAVEELGVGLTERTRDLRVLVLLALARLHLNGLPAFAEVVGGIRALLETRWEQVHPQLDPEDDNDPTLRANALLRLADPAMVLRPVRDLPLANGARVGRVAWRDIAIANGALEPDDGRERLSEAQLRGAFAETNQAVLDSVRAAVRTLADDLTAIPAAFDAHAGFGTGPDFEDVVKLLREIGRDLDRYSPAAGADAAAESSIGPEASAPESAAPAANASAAAHMPGTAGPVRALSLASITSREEALHLLGLVQAYYEQYEPASPLALLMDRARRLAEMSFLDILRDIAPDALGQAQMVTGARE